MFKRIILSFWVVIALSVNPLAIHAADADEKELFLVSQKAFEDGFYDVAIRYINQLLQDFPQTPKRTQANLLLGQCYFFKSQYLKAFEIFQGLLSSSEYKDATLFWLGETYLKGSDYAQAEKQYRELISLNPSSEYVPQAYYSLGWLYVEQNQYDKAKEALTTLLQKYPQHQLAEEASYKLAETEYNLKNYDKAASRFRDFVQAYPQSTRHAEAYFYIGESCYYLNNFADAVGYYLKAGEISYDNKLTLMSKISLAWSYFKLGKTQQADESFATALKFANEKGLSAEDVFIGQASLYAQLKENDKALAAYKSVVEKFPQSARIAEAMLGLANSYYALNTYGEAVSAYQHLIDQFGADASQKDTVEKARFGLAWSYLKAGQTDQSIRSFEEINNHTDNKIVKVSVLSQIGDAYQDVGQFEKATDVYQRILKDYPESPYTDYVLFRLGISQLKKDKFDDALQTFQRLQESFPQSKYILDSKYYLAVVYFKKGDWTTAKNLIQDFLNAPNISTNEFLAEGNYILALSTFNLEDYPNALKLFQKIIKNFPDQSAMVKSAELNIAKCLYKTGGVNEAVKSFKLLLNKYPQSDIAEESLIWLGDHYLENSDFNNATAYYQQFLNDYPKSEKINTVRYQLGQVYQALEKYDDAVKVLKEINDPNDPELTGKAQLILANIFAKDMDPETAVDAYQKIVKSSPEFKREAYLKIADIYKNNKEFGQAIDAYKQALKSAGRFSQNKSSEIQFMLGDCYEQSNMSKEAIDEYLRIPYLYPKEIAWVVKAYLRVARLFEDSEQWEQAQLTYQKVIDLKTDEAAFAQERIDWIKENIKGLNSGG